MKCKKNEIYFKKLQETKYLEIQLTQQVNDFFNENLKAVMKEIEVDRKYWKYFPCCR